MLIKNTTTGIVYRAIKIEAEEEDFTKGGYIKVGYRKIYAKNGDYLLTDSDDNFLIVSDLKGYDYVHEAQYH